MANKFSLSICCLLILNVLSAQKSQVQSAWRALSDYEEAVKNNDQKSGLNYLLKAKESIDKALLNEDTKNQSKTHAYKLRISYSQYQYNLSQELVRLESSIQDKNERYTVAYGNVGLTEFEEANAELKIIIDLDPKFIETIQKGINDGASSLEEEELKFAIAVQQMKEEAPNIASGKYKVKQYEIAADYFYKSAFMNTVLYKTKDTANFYNACIAASKSKNPEKIIDYNKKMIDSKLDIPFNYQSISDAYLLKSDTAEALVTLKKGREIFPDDFDLLTKETQLFISSGKQNEALANLKISIQKDQKNPLYYLMAGNIYDNLANPKDAQNGKDLPKPVNFNEMFSNAENNYLKAIEFSSSNKEYLYNSLYNLGAMYNNYGAYVESKGMEKISDLSKQQKESAEKSQVYFKKAIPYLEQALAIKSDDKATMQALRLLYFKTGDETKAKAMSEKIKTAK